MSGDLGPRAVISALEKFLDLHPEVDVTIVGDQALLQPLLLKSRRLFNSTTLVHAPDTVSMDDDPITALRKKKNSSMWRALECLRAEDADACVSAGNTGALLAMSKHLIKTFPDIDRPAICKSMPVANGLTYLLDLGANIDCAPFQLHQFALMGAALAEIMGIDHPRVALLNIGIESQKGPEVLQEARNLLSSDNRINYVGFVEPNDIFTGKEHVIVCDGFHGNIALKASEGAARFISKKIASTVQRNLLNKFLFKISASLFNQLREELDPSLYNGASLLGLKKTVIKSHGGADQKAFMHALLVAREQVMLQVPERIATQLITR